MSCKEGRRNVPALFRRPRGPERKTPFLSVNPITANNLFRSLIIKAQFN